ncbi:DUF2442 domain-containing protein [Candidatus Saccharibacteria bacterium]|nr:DUF2442 domain-containing protein [Candidatus Saccharibacteria bacterium]
MKEKLNYKKPNWTVTDVKPMNDYILLVTFISGEKKKVDMKELINRGGVFAKLKDPEIFKMAHVDSPTVVWNRDIDIAPESLYERGIAID